MILMLYALIILIFVIIITCLFIKNFCGDSIHFRKINDNKYIMTVTNNGMCKDIRIVSSPVLRQIMDDAKNKIVEQPRRDFLTGELIEHPIVKGKKIKKSIKVKEA